MLLDFLKASSYDWTVRKMSIDVLYTFAAVLREDGVSPFKNDILEILAETRTDKIKPVRDASLEAINAVRDLIDTHPRTAASPRQSIKSAKRVAEVKKSSPPRNLTK